jgi:hypothetical protein
VLRSSSRTHGPNSVERVIANACAAAFNGCAGVAQRQRLR